jgi:hypothetical protein
MSLLLKAAAWSWPGCAWVVGWAVALLGALPVLVVERLAMLVRWPAPLALAAGQLMCLLQWRGSLALRAEWFLVVPMLGMVPPVLTQALNEGV